MAGPWGFNFRATLGFVTDAPTDSAVLGDLYPTVFSNGLTAGWIDEPEERDRNSGIDPRLAGVAQRGNDGTQKTFQVDLPSSGSYAITLALGDADNAQSYQYIQMLDGATPVLTIADAAGTAFQSFDDATGTEYDAATWPGSNTPVTVTLSGTTLNVTIGSPGVQAGNSTLAHLSINPTGGSSPTVTPTGFGLTVSLGTPTLTNTALKVLPIGYGLTVSLGTPSVHNGTDPFLTPTGYGLTATLGTPSVKLSGVRVSPAGFGLTISEGSFTTQNDVTLTGITGFGLATSLGTPTELRSGVQINPSGFALSTTLGTPLVRLTQVLSPTGFGLTVSRGTPTLGGSPTQSPPGYGLTVSLGTPTVIRGNNPVIIASGFAWSISLGTPTVSTFQQITVTPTGFELVASQGSPVVTGVGTTILLLGSVTQLNTTPRVRQLVTTPIVRQPHG